MLETFQIKRKDLYNQIWSTPMTKLAKQYGLSDVGLRKKCKKLNIPLPPMGYWQKKAYGKDEPRPPLQALEGREDVEFSIVNDNRPIDKEQNNEALSKIAFEKLDINKIKVAPTLTSPHPYVLQAEKNLKKAKHNKSNILYPNAKKCLDINVGTDSLGRALRIMDALIKTLEIRNYTVSIIKKNEKDEYASSVSLLGETFEICIEEILDRTERELTPTQKREKQKDPWLHSYPIYDYSPSGRLSLKIKELEGSGVRKIWSDGKKRKVEDSLNAFIVGLIRAAVEKRTSRLESEERERKWQEQKDRREEQIKEIERIKTLKEEAKAWNESQQLRAYIKAVEEDALQRHDKIKQGSELDQWLVWANQQADRLDPLTENPPSILDQKVDSWCSLLL